MVGSLVDVEEVIPKLALRLAQRRPAQDVDGEATVASVDGTDGELKGLAEVLWLDEGEMVMVKVLKIVVVPDGTVRVVTSVTVVVPIKILLPVELPGVGLRPPIGRDPDTLTHSSPLQLVVAEVAVI